MVGRRGGSGQTQIPPRPTTTVNNNPATAFISRLQQHGPNSTRFIGFLTLIISGGILFLLTCATITATVLGLIFFTPFLVLSSPIWVPISTVILCIVAGILSLCGSVVVVAAALTWIYKYVRGLQPPGSDRVDYARIRFADSASHVKDYAREYGGYLQSKVMDATPGA
ncbi:Oleosin like [Actinidia chinensis var. chinensis]|uniref:Oleosin like n=1 Tax=Actinidia chinensis var. chinensis TaxID=1590841 RepID=A0A2R6QI71_ACTCC|nr:Oleosin like [Actinidia chinensis var. chinensis]